MLQLLRCSGLCSKGTNWDEKQSFMKEQKFKHLFYVFLLMFSVNMFLSPSLLIKNLSDGPFRGERLKPCLDCRSATNLVNVSAKCREAPNSAGKQEKRVYGELCGTIKH